MTNTHKKTKGRKRRRGGKKLFIAVLVLLGIVTCAVLSFTVLFPISEITVTGDVTSYTDSVIIAASGLKTGDNTLAFSSSAVEKKICDEHMYIESVKVRRTLSGKITLECKEAYDFLALPLENSFCLILTPNLKIIEKASSNKTGFAEIYGLSPTTDKTGGILQSVGEDGTTYLRYVVEAADKFQMLDHITAINVSDKLNLSIIYDNRFLVMIGTANQIEYKLKMLRQIVTENIGEAETGYIDISVTSKATYKIGPLEVPEGYKTPAPIVAEKQKTEENV